MVIVVGTVQYVGYMERFRIVSSSGNITAYRNLQQCKLMWPDYDWQEVFNHPDKIYEV